MFLSEKLFNCLAVNGKYFSSLTRRLRFDFIVFIDSLQFSTYRRKTANQSWIIRDRFFMDHDSDVVRTPPPVIDALPVTENGSLIIKNMSTTYSSAYYCKRLQDNVKFDSNTFVFFVDVLNPKQGTDQGGVDAYLEYKKKYLDPIRKYIKWAILRPFQSSPYTFSSTRPPFLTHLWFPGIRLIRISKIFCAEQAWAWRSNSNGVLGPSVTLAPGWKHASVVVDWRPTWPTRR